MFMAKRKRGLSLKQKLKNAAAKRKIDSKWTNRIIDGITISFGVNNILPDTMRTGGTIIQRFKMGINEVVGRTTGNTIFPDAPSFSRRFDIENALTNPQTTAGVAALIWNQVAKKVKILPLKSESRRFAKKNIAVGIGTGLFGDKSGASLTAGLTGSAGNVQTNSQPLGVSQ